MIGRAALAALLAAFVMLAFAGSALADSTVNVTTTSDSPTAGQCSLREAVAYANGNAGGRLRTGDAVGHDHDQRSRAGPTP